jgi:hypothetical protein
MFDIPLLSTTGESAALLEQVSAAARTEAQTTARHPANCEDVPQLPPSYCAQYIFKDNSEGVLQVTA